ncbi:MAG: EF-hand domain-containing protein [Sedimentitalea sp.]|uniref:EF-hand domain-containing protein n=1 Tax=Sedimentitalea sp. TaxID=2048915 RepID=UPI00326538D8
MNRPRLVAVLAFMPHFSFAQQTPGTHFIENGDLDAKGSVTLKEIPERRGDAFYMFDQNEDDLLSTEEYVFFDEPRAADMAANAENDAHGKGAEFMQAGLTLGFNDTDFDGQVSRTEFLARSTAWFEMIDRNRDPAVTSGGFGPRNN